MNTVEKILELCREKKIAISSVERACGFANGYIKGLKKGTMPIERLEKVSAYLGVPLEDLAEEKMKIVFRTQAPGPNKLLSDMIANVISQYPVGRMIPLYGKVSAGIPIEENGDKQGEVMIPEDMSGDYFALTIKGDSMEPRMYTGDIVIVHQQSDVESGQIAIVSYGHEYATCKKVIKSEDGIMLRGFNPSFDPIFVPAEKADRIIILGRVIECRQKY